MIENLHVECIKLVQQDAVLAVFTAAHVGGLPKRLGLLPFIQLYKIIKGHKLCFGTVAINASVQRWRMACSQVHFGKKFGKKVPRKERQWAAELYL
jgi:hypothetical protein